MKGVFHDRVCVYGEKGGIWSALYAYRLLKQARTSGEVRRDGTPCRRASAIFFPMVSNCKILLFFLSQRKMRTRLGMREREGSEMNKESGRRAGLSSIDLGLTNFVYPFKKIVQACLR